MNERKYNSIKANTGLDDDQLKMHLDMLHTDYKYKNSANQLSSCIMYMAISRAKGYTEGVKGLKTALVGESV